MNRTIKIGLACLFGTGLGSVMMLEIKPSLWTLGLVFGFLGGYVSYEVRKILAAGRQACRMTAGWQPDREWWRAYYKCSLAMVGALIATVSMPLLGVSTWAAREGSSDLAYALCFLSAGSIVMFVLIVATSNGAITAERLRYDAKLFGGLDPFRFYFWLLPKYALLAFPLATRWVWRRRVEIWQGTRGVFGIARNFLKYWFLFVHSEERLLCGMGSLVGAATFHYSHNNAWIGMASGVLFGVIEYEVVSKRWLKLARRRTS